MKGSIEYSKYNSQKLTEVYDRLLEFRDEFCFATLLRGCRRGYLPGRENGNRKQGRGRIILNAVIWIYLGWWALFLPKMFLFLTAPLHPTEDAIWIAIVCMILYWIFLSPRSVMLYRTDWDPHGKSFQPLWENRKDCPYHVLYKPVFYGLSMRRAKRRIRRAKQVPDRYSEQQLLKLLYESAYELSALRSICTVSEEIQRYVDLCGMENIEIDFKEDRRLTYNKPEEVFRIELSGKILTDPDSVIPVVEDVQSVTFMLPYIAGKEIARKYRRKERLDLTVMDERYKDLRRDFGTYKKSAEKLLQGQRTKTNSAVLQALDKVQF